MSHRGFLKKYFLSILISLISFILFSFILFFSIFFLSSFLLALEASDPFSLADIFSPGKTLLDTDGDGLIDDFNLTIILPNQPDPLEMASAAEIASRLSFESLAARFDLVRREKEIGDWSKVGYFILVGDKFQVLRQPIFKASALRPLNQDEGLIMAISLAGQSGVLLRAGSPEALLLTARAFFNRFPYLWDIFGPETGETYDRVEKAAADFGKLVSGRKILVAIKEILYEFPKPKAPFSSLQRLRFDHGEIREMVIDLNPVSAEESWQLRKALEALKIDHDRGKRTDLLSWAGCSRLTFIFNGQREKSISLDRVGLPRRFLTPSYKSPRITRGPSKDFDLLDLFSLRGLYSDSNSDGLPDGLDSLVIIPPDSVIPGLPYLGIRISLESAGLAWPLFYPADQLEEPRALLAPILIGENTLSQELKKAGKLRLPALQAGQGTILVVPQAFPRSNAVVIQAADNEGMEKILRYLSLIFPYLENYGPGQASWKEVRRDLENFFKGEKGAAEAYFYHQIEKILNDLRKLEIEEIKIEVTLPQPNRAFHDELKNWLSSLFPKAKTEVKMHGLRESQIIFQKEKEFPWEGEEALRLIDEQLKILPPEIRELRISLALSESPKIRREIKHKIESKLRSFPFPSDIKVLSSYKAGFFWLLEEVAPQLKGKEISRLLIRVAKEKDDRSRPKRFYVDPNRWLQELYPIDEILARELSIPLEKIDFELKDKAEPIYEALAYDNSNQLILATNFTPLVKKITYWPVLPEWGEVTITPSWLRLESEGKILAEVILASDLENFWTFYHKEIIPALHQHIMKKTGEQPTTAKQPYFKKLTIELEASEPDYRLNLDEEMISSLEAIHDEIYFDTLDYLRGITEVEIERTDEMADTSRLSAPGHVFPLLHPSKDGQPTRVRIQLEDWKAASPVTTITWKEKGHLETSSRRLNFPRLQPRTLRLMGLTFDGRSNRLDNGWLEVEIENESDYHNLVTFLDHLPLLEKKGLLVDSFFYPGLNRIILKIKHKDWSREISLPVKAKREVLSIEKEKKVGLPQKVDLPSVPTEIISPEKCLELVRALTSVAPLRGYIAGRSYEGREVPVIEAFLPSATYISLPRLMTFKPTLLASGRQHANEVSATTYLLQLAEKIIKEEEWQSFLKKINLILLPMENPDGAALAYELQKLTPHHSLHAGRYSSLGVDIGSLVGQDNPLLPEARVRRDLMERWRPDIYLNLHGYPSHEWVQPFSGYTPFLFRDYWIPKGWFAFFRSLRLSVFEPWTSAGRELEKYIIEEMRSLPHFNQSSQKFYDRYFRWGTRWSPHAAELEIYDGVNLYAKRRSSQETRLSPRTQITYIEETPELMDETAQGQWLELLCELGLAYLQAHLKFLGSKKHDLERIDEEVQERVRQQWLRRRPVGSIGKE